MQANSVIPGIALADCQELYEKGQAIILVFEVENRVKVPDTPEN